MKKIVSLALVAMFVVASCCAPQNKKVQVLTVGTGVTLNDIVGKFAVTPKKNEENNTETAYAIDSSGMLYLGE